MSTLPDAVKNTRGASAQQSTYRNSGSASRARTRSRGTATMRTSQSSATIDHGTAAAPQNSQIQPRFHAWATP